jgi:hypothetical protein
LATKLQIYNDALLAVKAARIKALTDQRSERRDLDAVWDQTQKYMLESGLWNFASRAAALEPSSDLQTQFGWNNVYERPDDYVSLVAISDNERFNEVTTFLYYEEYGETWLADVQPLYVLYVSKDLAYGLDVGKYPEHFATAFSLELAWRAGPKVGNLKAPDRDLLYKLKKKALVEARSFDARNQPPVPQSSGRLSLSRGGSRSTINAQRKAGYIRG